MRDNQMDKRIDSDKKASTIVSNKDKPRHKTKTKTKQKTNRKTKAKIKKMYKTKT